VLRKGNFSTRKRQEENDIIDLFCTIIGTLLKYVTDLSYNFHIPFTSFDRHLSVFVYSDGKLILAQPVIELVMCIEYVKRKKIL
jgi:hypothetical protein